jgi:hypothetical protein
MVDGLEIGHTPEPNKLFCKEISEREMRADVLDQWAKKLKVASELLRKESSTAFHADERQAVHGHHSGGKPVRRGVGLLDSKVDVPLGDGTVLGFHLSLEEIEAFAENPTEFVAAVNRHCFVYGQGLSTSDNPIRARISLKEGRVIIEDDAKTW